MSHINWVGPSYQFAVGLSDPSEWNLANGQAADPNVIPGAFSDATGTWSETMPQPCCQMGSDLHQSGWQPVKTYRLVENGIQVLYQVQGSGKHPHSFGG